MTELSLDACFEFSTSSGGLGRLGVVLLCGCPAPDSLEVTVVTVWAVGFRMGVCNGSAWLSPVCVADMMSFGRLLTGLTVFRCR